MNPKLLLAAASALVLAACSDSDDDGSGSSLAQTDIAASLPGQGLDTLSAALEAAELDDDLAGDGPFTLLAPSDAAFDALPDGTLDALLLPENQDLLIDVLLYHVVDGEARSEVVMTLDSAATLQGSEVLIDQVGGSLLVNGAAVINADVDATNGVIHVIDQVLLPPQSLLETLEARGFATLIAALEAADLVAPFEGAAGEGEGLTLLAPTDAAFEALPAGVLDELLEPENMEQLVDVLTYHVVPAPVKASAAVEAETPKALNEVTLLFAASETGATVNGVTISAFNVPCTNGILHVLDAVLLPPSDIVTLAGEAGLTTLGAAVAAADLADALSGPGPFTVFAPTDEAFAALPEGALETLLEPANQGLLISVLQYHVVADELTAAEVLGNDSLTTLGGLDVSVGTEPPSIDGAGIAVTNVLARNGIVHVIDTVLLPPGFELPMLASQSAEAGPPPVRARFGAELVDFLEFGPDTLPTWYGVAGSRASGWSGFSSAENPIRPSVEGSAGGQLFAGRAARADADGALRWTSLPASLRIAEESERVPLELVLHLRSTGADDLELSLRYVGEDGELVAATPEQLDSFPSAVAGARETVATWRPADAGRPIDGLDVVVTTGAPGLDLEAVRLISLD